MVCLLHKPKERLDTMAITSWMKVRKAAFCQIIDQFKDLVIILCHCRPFCYYGRVCMLTDTIILCVVVECSLWYCIQEGQAEAADGNPQHV